MSRALAHTDSRARCAWTASEVRRDRSGEDAGRRTMLGVRREGVTAAAGKLHKLGAIHYVRGKITCWTGRSSSSSAASITPSSRRKVIDS
jgi:hypothetical protein